MSVTRGLNTENCAVNFKIRLTGSHRIQAKIGQNRDGPVYTDLTKTR